MSRDAVKWNMIYPEQQQISGNSIYLVSVTTHVCKLSCVGVNMPPIKPKPSEIAAEAKKTYIPYIRQNYGTQWPAQSFLCHSDSLVAPAPQATRHCRFGKII